MFLADNFLGMHMADWVVLACYFVLIAGIGIWSLKKVKDMSDFFMGGRRFGKVFMMFFAFGAGTSSEQAISVVAGTWRVGLAGIWWQFLWLWATPFYWIVAPVMRRMRALTTADFFEHRYNTGAATLYTIAGIIMAIVFIAGGLFSSGKMVTALTGGELDRVAQEISIEAPTFLVNSETGERELSWRQVEGYEYAILVMTVLFVAYGMAGGLGAAIITDFIQGVLTIAFSFLLLPCVFQMIGGFGQLHTSEGIKPGMFDFVARPEVAEALGKEPITIFFVVMLSLTALCGIVVQPHIMGVCGAGKTEFEGRFGFTVGNFLKRFCTIAWTFTGLACIVWYLGSQSPLLHLDKPEDASSAEFQALPAEVRTEVESDRLLYQSLATSASGELGDLDDDTREDIVAAEVEFSDRLFGDAAYRILPAISPGLIGLLMASLLAAVMSTSDAQMVVGSGLFTENIYRRFFVRNGSDRHYLWAGRIAGLVIVFLAIVLQTMFNDVIHALDIIIKTPAAIGISLWFGIVWRRWNARAVWASTLAAVGMWYLTVEEPELIKSLGFVDFMFRPGEGVKMGGAWINLCYVGTGVIAGVIVSLLTRPRPQEQLDHFFRLIHTPITPGEHVEAPCTLPENPAPQGKKLFSHPDIELPRPTVMGLGGFALAWGCVGLIIWLTQYLVETL